MVSAQASTETTPIESVISDKLLPLAERALESSQTSDSNLEYYKQQWTLEREQRKKDNEERLRELTRYQTLLAQSSSRVATLQTYFDSLLQLLGVSETSEAQKYEAAKVAVSDIKEKAEAEARDKEAWKLAGFTGAGMGLGALGGGIAGGGAGAMEGALIGAAGGVAAKFFGQLTGLW